MDNIDRNILNVVQLDASLSMDALAERVNLSRNACWRRVKRLEDAGVIRGRVTLLNPMAVDLGLSVFVLIRTSAHEPGWLEKFEAAVRTMPEILGVSLTTACSASS